MTQDIVKIVIVDDHALVRESVSKTLELEPNFEVVGKASNASEAIDVAVVCKPDIMLMDIDMPGMISFDAARRIASLLPDTKIIFLSAFINDRFIEQAIAVGAKGYVTKEESTQILIEAIQRVSRGEIFFSEPIWGRIVIGPKGIKLAESATTLVSTLTIREIEVLRYVACGMSKKEIAATMHLSIKTVEVHTVNLMKKLDIHDRVELARYAIREGIAKA